MTTDKEETSFEKIYLAAAEDAMKHGIGLIIFTGNNSEMEVSRVSRNKHLELAELLIRLVRTSKTPT